jgi:hypothetical protein
MGSPEVFDYEEWARATAELFPNLRAWIDDAKDLHDLWIRLWMAFERAYDDLPDHSFIAEVHRFALFCLGSRDWKVREGVEIGFYEDLASSVYDDEPRFRAKMRDVARYITPDKFLSLRAVFGYSLQGYGWETFLSDYESPAREI